MDNKEHKIQVNDSAKIFPVRKDGKLISVVFVADDNYINFLGVAINSIISNASRNRTYDIIVITTDISDQHISDLLTLIIDKPNISVRFADISHYTNTNNFLVSSNYTVFTYFRLLLPDIVVDMDRLLYLDADVIVNDDLTELYDTDFEGNCIAGTYDTQVAAWQNYNSGMRSYFRSLGLNTSGEYVQAGVLLFNMHLICEKADMKSILARACSEKFVFNDQDLINIYFKGKIKILNLKWDVLNHNDVGTVDCEEHLLPQQKDDFLRSLADPRIIHFVERSFPCNRESGPYDDLYWKYARNTIFYDRLMKIREDHFPTSHEKLSQSAMQKKETLSIKLRQILKKSKVLVGMVHAVRKISSRTSLLPIMDMDIVGDYIKSNGVAILKPGAELSCLHCIWNNGEHTVVIKTVTTNMDDRIIGMIAAGYRHEELLKIPIHNGINKLKVNLEEARFDVEFIIKNNSENGVKILSVMLEHRS